MQRPDEGDRGRGAMSEWDGKLVEGEMRMAG